MIKRLMPYVKRLIWLAGLTVVMSASADAADIGRVTGNGVSFRVAPSTKAQRIKFLAPDTELEIMDRVGADWYLVRHARRRGFVHKNYVEVQPKYSILKVLEAVTRRQLAMGVISLFISLTLIVHYSAPFISKVARVLIISAIAIVSLDVGFQFGMLYSVVLVSLGLLLVASFLSRKRRPPSASGTSAPPTQQVA